MPRERIRYEFDPVPENIRPTITWTLGSDPKTQALCQRLGFQPLSSDIEFVQKAVERNPEALAKITDANGRSATFQAEPVVIGGPYDAIQIGGFGNFPLIETRGRMGFFARNTPISLPTSENFAQTNSETTVTGVIGENGYEVHQDPFSFTGAYTQKQACFKAAASLGLLEYAIEKQGAFFAVPIPIAIGAYPTIVDPDGKPAHFIAWRVPFEGKRLGSFTLRENIEEESMRLDVLINKATKINRALRILHDAQLTHNQTTLGNFYISDEGAVFLADLSTLFPISQKTSWDARAYNVFGFIYSFLNFINLTYPGVDRADAVNHLFRMSIQYYLGRPPSASLVTPHNYLEAIRAEIKQAARDGTFPKAARENKAWNKIKEYEAMLLAQAG